MSLNIYQRINEVRKKIDYIKKDKDVSTGKGSYRAVTHDMVTAMVRAHMVEVGIVCVPFLVKCESIQPPPTNDGPAKQIRYEAEYDFWYTNIDQPEDKICIRISAHAMDSADKAPGKALSYAKKYAALKLFEIETGEDEESRTFSADGMDETQLADYLAAIDECADKDSLLAKYTEAYKAAQKINDEEAMAKIIAAKDRKKQGMK